ncbi:hypothetical protein T12_13711 [Trichinella patagoniensis]|uniref:Uncharacterized protein n=1 Tax=Trichinella patagoniensis TaxID=990121 RepID=A0A0V0ZSU2_9BILA|nr:hypothetical protein T12_13711 [Trichinella patagoniensis]
MIRPTKKLRLLEPAMVDGVPPSSGEDVTDSNRTQKPEYQESTSNKALVFSFEIDLWLFVIERPGGIPITLDVTGNIRD